MRSAITVLAVLLCAGLVLAGMELTSARLYKKQGEWLKSWQFYNQAVEKTPDDLDARFERGELCKDVAGDSSKLSLAKEMMPQAADPAAALYDQMLADFADAQRARTPKDESTVKRLKKKIDGILQDRWNHFYFLAVQSDSAYTKAKAENIETPDPKTYLHEALQHLATAVKMVPERWNAYGLKAQVEGKLDDDSTALESWKLAQQHIEASDLKKREPETYVQATEVIQGNILQANYNLGRIRETISTADEILAKDPGNLDAVQFKAFAQARLANDTTIAPAQRDTLKMEAIRSLTAARTARPEDEIIVYYIGQFYLQLGDTTAAMMAFDDYLKLDDKDKDVLFTMGVLYLEGGSHINTAKARDTFARIVELYPDHGPSWINYGIALIRLKDNVKGKEAIEKGKALGGN